MVDRTGKYYSTIVEGGSWDGNDPFKSFSYSRIALDNTFSRVPTPRESGKRGWNG
jgi:hypothetical protein